MRPTDTARFAVALLLPAALAVPTVPTAFAADDSKRALKATRYAIAASRAFDDGDLQRAKNSYERALAFYPDHPDARIGMGKIMMLERKYEAALNHFQRARDAFAEFSRMLADRAVQRYAAAQDEVARLQDRKFQLQQRLSQAEARSRNGRAGAAASGVEMAIGELDNRIRRLQALDPPGRIERPEPPAGIHFAIGNALFQLERYDEAVAAWVECVEVEPRFAPAYNNLALVYGMFERFEEARAWIARARDVGVDLNDDLLRDLERLETARASD